MDQCTSEKAINNAQIVSYSTKSPLDVKILAGIKPYEIRQHKYHPPGFHILSSSQLAIEPLAALKMVKKRLMDVSLVSELSGREVRKEVCAMAVTQLEQAELDIEEANRRKGDAQIFGKIERANELDREIRDRFDRALYNAYTDLLLDRKEAHAFGIQSCWSRHKGRKHRQHHHRDEDKTGEEKEEKRQERERSELKGKAEGGETPSRKVRNEGEDNKKLRTSEDIAIQTDAEDEEEGAIETKYIEQKEGRRLSFDDLLEEIAAKQLTVQKASGTNDFRSIVHRNQRAKNHGNDDKEANAAANIVDEVMKRKRRVSFRIGDASETDKQQKEEEKNGAKAGNADEVVGQRQRMSNQLRLNAAGDDESLLFSAERVKSSVNVCPCCDELNPLFWNGQFLRRHLASQCVYLTRCEFCDKVVEVHALNEHQLQRCPFVRNWLAECPLCGLARYPDQPEAHPRCRFTHPPAGSAWCPLCSELIRNGDSRREWLQHLTLECQNNPRNVRWSTAAGEGGHQFGEMLTQLNESVAPIPFNPDRGQARPISLALSGQEKAAGAESRGMDIQHLRAAVRRLNHEKRVRAIQRNMGKDRQRGEGEEGDSDSD